MSRRPGEDSEDEARLPEDVQRVGYDADTQTYSYRDQDGSYWEGAPGARYGVLHRSGSGYQPMTMENERELRKSYNEAWRYILPFFLLVSVCLLGLYRFLGSASAAQSFACAESSLRYLVKEGDSCWDIAHARGAMVEDLVRLNHGMDCGLLVPGREICVPISE
ncbi:carbohydrate-binding module family 50 protein [Hyaloscypha variabilis]|uniref:Carbohydrate-binding module family 50 protein n=1 Tax=Hyaloscypha variabilis (strain UAMH 11265 / GT02V1 / F) TaxID=1149755 RepID=A0A2J6QT52_HYAVF|nr:carbohydrate-binding module family 50 protein [Hyaloscypha variabilis F]